MSSLTAWIDARLKQIGIWIGHGFADRLSDRAGLDDLNETFGDFLLGLNTHIGDRQ